MSTRIVFDDTPLLTKYGRPDLLTAIVPDLCFSRPGHYRVCLVDDLPGRSNDLLFTVAAAPEVPPPARSLLPGRSGSSRGCDAGGDSERELRSGASFSRQTDRVSVRGWLAVLRHRVDLDLPDDLVRSVLQNHGLDPWFFEGVLRQRNFYYWNAWRSSFWLAQRLPANGRILETGCGPGFNLVWLGQQGFRHLYGTDIDDHALAAAQDLCQAACVPATFWRDDSLRPSATYPGLFHAILALNWTYLVEPFDLEAFLRLYGRLLTPGGYLVIDVIDASYNTVPKNQYHTSDWSKPEHEWRPSEYRNRYWGVDVQHAVTRADLHCVKVLTGPKSSKVVYILRRVPSFGMP